MSLQPIAKLYKGQKEYTFSTKKDFLLVTEGYGMKCGLCNSKIFFDYNLWKRHCQGKKHNKLFSDVDNTNIIDIDYEKLKEELKIQKALLCQKSNECEVYKNKLRYLRAEFKKLQLAIKTHFDLS